LLAETSSGIRQRGTAACLLGSRLQYLFDTYVLPYVQS
jgi:hypothetical protein